MATLANLTIRDAHPTDHPAAARVLADAFHDGAVTRWAEPDPTTRTAQLPPYFTAVIEHAAGHGTVRLAHVDDQPVAVAVWYEYPLHPSTLDVHDILGAGDETAVSDGARRLAELEQALAGRHPRERPHHYLAYLGVTPDRQGHGIGTALLADRHRHLDPAGLPAYLEANDPRNGRLYLRLGYTDLDTPVTVHASPPVQPMWRPTAG